MSLFQSSKHTFLVPGEPASKRCVFQDFLKTELVNRFTFHNFEIFNGMGRMKMHPTQSKTAIRQKALGQIVFAASVGDISSLVMLRRSGLNLYRCDYDRRTAVHLAAAEGNVDVLRFLIKTAPAD